MRYNAITQEKKEFLEEVWQYFGEYHAYYLSDMIPLERTLDVVIVQEIIWGK